METEHDSLDYSDSQESEEEKIEEEKIEEKESVRENSEEKEAVGETAPEESPITDDQGDDRDYPDDSLDEEIPLGPTVKVAVDWMELEGALENNSPELHSFLNNATGDVIRIVQGGEGAEARLREVEENDDYFYIEPISSREQYHWMEEFVETIEDPTLKDKLNIAIDGKGAFRRFKDVLMAYPADRERWFSRRADKLRSRMQEWLRRKLIEATNTPPWEGGQDASEHPRDGESQGALEQGRGHREGNIDLRSSAHKLIDLVPSRELPTAVAFLEFLRGRRGFRGGRFS